jgi:hypothetical protein
MRVFPHVYGQQDPRWSAQRLGSADGVTIGGDGCYLTCFAMKAGYYGHTIAPNALDDMFTNRNLYTDGDMLCDDQLAKVYADVSFQAAYPYPGPADLGLLKRLSADDSLTVTMELDFDHNPNDGIQTHFVELQSYDGGTLLILDPWYSDTSGQYGEIADFTKHYGNDPATTIQKFVVYKGKPAPIPVTAASFTATPMHTPLGFYASATFAQHLYDSQATRDTMIQYDAWTHGAGVTDPATGQIDRRWYRRHNPGGQAGWTPSAWVSGNAPGSTP